jgi:hypothetical protein
MDNTKNKKPFYKKWWFWTIVIFVVVVVSAMDEDVQTTENANSNLSTIVTQATENECIHNWLVVEEIEATCESQMQIIKMCLLCNESVTEYEGKKISPITILDWYFTIDSANGGEWVVEFISNSDKDIKYTEFTWLCYNAVGDRVYDMFNGNHYLTLVADGDGNDFLSKGEVAKFHNSTKFYNSSLRKSKLWKIKVQYADGTMVSITEAEYKNIIAD